MKKTLSIVLGIVGVILLTASYAPAQLSVQVLSKEGMGNYLADGKGRTLYWFKNDVMGKSTCSGACIEKWPAFYSEAINVLEPLSPKEFGSITREDGTKQTTFRGFPLYYWVKDTAKGDTTGHGVNDVWFVVNPLDFPPAGAQCQ
ncbi:MAG: COG4315 family predicted lipoprotein [Desulfomonilia bacterium]